MEGTLLAILGGRDTSSHAPMNLSSLDERVLHLQTNAIEKSTSKGYATGARDYIQFCLAHHLPLDPTPQTLARYIVYTSLFIASGPKYLTGVCHFLQDLYPDFDHNQEHPFIKSTICGSKKVHADPITQKLPLHTSHLETFFHVACHTHAYDDLLFMVILSCCFYACHHSGEFIQKNDHSLFDWRKVIKRASLTFDGRHAQYHLPYHKGDPFFHGMNILFTPQQVADPISLQQFVQFRDQLHGARAALFLCENGSHPTHSWFDSNFFALLDLSFGGHSLCAGGVTFCASLGIPESVIQAIGRWSSTAWKIYICDHPSIQEQQQLGIIRYHLQFLPT
ncbi:hypothetical protein L208DRAFT_1417220 [Tricholoma matsutake]|nr:hypothetical protein L208DRAFT_1417220 [Tricholoma matsutake 945]